MGTYMKSKRDDELVKTTKGYLYEIRTQENELTGYLFGTRHELCINKLQLLDPRVLACFDKSSHLFLEQEHNIDTASETPPRGVDEFLHRRAIAQEKNIGGLETILTRKEIEEKLESDEIYQHLEVKAQGIILLTFRHILTKYNQLEALSHIVENVDDLITTLNIIQECMPLLVSIIDIENQKFFPRELDDKLFKIIDEISKLLYVFALIPNRDFLKEKLLAQRENDEKCFGRGYEDKYEELVRKYVDGDETRGDQSTPQGMSDLQISLKKYKDELGIKILQERDAVMADTIHKDLLITVSTKGERCGFYAPGAYHVLGPYPNSLPLLLKQRGWKIERIDLSHPLTKETPKPQLTVNQSFFNNKLTGMNSIKADQTNFFTIQIQDKTPTDPYNRGAIVPYQKY